MLTNIQHIKLKGGEFILPNLSLCFASSNEERAQQTGVAEEKPLTSWWKGSRKCREEPGEEIAPFHAVPQNPPLPTRLHFPTGSQLERPVN